MKCVAVAMLAVTANAAAKSGWWIDIDDKLQPFANKECGRLFEGTLSDQTWDNCQTAARACADTKLAVGFATSKGPILDTACFEAKMRELSGQAKSSAMGNICRAIDVSLANDECCQAKVENALNRAAGWNKEFIECFETGKRGNPGPSLDAIVNSLCRDGKFTGVLPGNKAGRHQCPSIAKSVLEGNGKECFAEAAQ